ncbi:MAG: GNAT family N-acetyltransferase [Clostridia bacterium]|nr:GNAT family N-acetyltransferase [Clostridia bacterium]
MPVRFAEKKDLERVNELRRQVHGLHAEGRPDIFKPGFSQELQDYIFTVWNDTDREIVVCERDGAIGGFAALHRIAKPENPYMRERTYLDIDEFGVDEACRREGVGTELMDFIRRYAKEQGYRRIELNMWEFNQDALAFYEAVGFTTYRRYMELDIGREGS